MSAMSLTPFGGGDAMNSGPSLHRYQPDQVQRVGWRYPSLSVTRLPGDENAIGA